MSRNVVIGVTLGVILGIGIFIVKHGNWWGILIYVPASIVLGLIIGEKL
jgi:hypothetical protein